MYCSIQDRQNLYQLEEKSNPQQVAKTLVKRSRVNPSNNYRTHIEAEHPFHQTEIRSCCAKKHSPFGYYETPSGPKQSKCRCERCTPDCWCNARQKECAILTKHLESLPSDFNKFYINCRFPQEPKKDKLCRKLVRQSIERLEDKLGSIVRLQLWLDLTANGVSYDGVLISDHSNPNKIIKAVQSIFAGLGLAPSNYCCIKHDESKYAIPQLAKYVTKNLARFKRQQGNGGKRQAFVFLPHHKGHEYYLDSTWGSRSFGRSKKDRSFYIGISKKQLWKDCCAEYGNNKLEWISPIDIQTELELEQQFERQLQREKRKADLEILVSLIPQSLGEKDITHSELLSKTGLEQIYFHKQLRKLVCRGVICFAGGNVNHYFIRPNPKRKAQKEESRVQYMNSILFPRPHMFPTCSPP